MQQRLHIALSLVLVMLAGVIAWQVQQLREPVYRGRRLSDWLSAYKLHGLAGVETWQVRLQQQEAEEALRHAGTNAFPTLLRMLRAKDSALKLKFMELTRRQHLIKFRYTPAEELNYRACSAFGVLHAKAQSAVPTLIEIANQNTSYASHWYALKALESVRPSDYRAAPIRSAMPMQGAGGYSD